MFSPASVSFDSKASISRVLSKSWSFVRPDWDSNSALVFSTFASNCDFCNVSWSFSTWN